MGENTKIENMANRKAWKLKLELEYAGKVTLQIEHLFNVRFYTIEGRAQSMMRNSNVSFKTRYKV